MNEKDISGKYYSKTFFHFDFPIYNIYININIISYILYWNDKEINPSYQVLRVSCKHMLQFSACT